MHCGCVRGGGGSQKGWPSVPVTQAALVGVLLDTGPSRRKCLRQQEQQVTPGSAFSATIRCHTVKGLTEEVGINRPCEGGGGGGG